MRESTVIVNLVSLPQVHLRVRGRLVMLPAFNRGLRTKWVRFLPGASSLQKIPLQLNKTLEAWPSLVYGTRLERGKVIL